MADPKDGKSIRANRFGGFRSTRMAAAIAPLLLVAGGAPVFAQQATSLPLLPQPRDVASAGKGFRAASGLDIVVPDGDSGADKAAAWLRNGLGLSGSARADAPVVRFERVAGLPKEGYRLSSSASGATISASDDAGLFYGAVTLWQLASSSGEVPAVSISDAPRFPWRGFMLDSARHFQSPEFVKRLIDAMAAHKLNILHWHLVDDQGWRIEIDKYPKLTEIGAWRIPASAPGAPPLPRTGGFYTKAQIREIVAYAAARNIIIVPEIEMPGHILSVLRAYPELGTGVPIPANIHSDWGVYPWLFNIEEPTFAFLDDVFTEVTEIFPSPYIHVGGDEAVPTQWEQSPAVQKRMRELGLADSHAVQSWFMKRVEKMLTRRGRKLIGWDEIIDGGLAPNATVMSWRGIKGAITAAQAGHDSVLAPSPDLYFDHVQGITAAEGPGRGKPNLLEDIYRFDPLPATLTADQQRHILGLQSTLFTEHVRGDERAAYMIFPRLSALAEVAWLGKGRDFEDFVDRLIPQMDRVKAIGLKPAESAFTPFARVQSVAAHSATVTLATQVKSEIRYTIDGSVPGVKSALYAGPVDVTFPTRLRAVAFRGGKRLPGAVDMRYDRAAALRRDDRELKACSNSHSLALIDDAPAEGPRADFLINILDPCWIYEAAPLDAVTAVEVEVGQVPFNFQLSNGRNVVPRARPATPAGELEIRAGGCQGEPIGRVSLTQVTSPALTRLSVPVSPHKGAQDLCLTFTGEGTDPLWTIKSVQLRER